MSLMSPVLAKIVLARAQAQIDEARAEIDKALTAMLQAATVEVAADYPGHEVAGVSAMGSWTITVYDVRFNNDGDEVASDSTEETYTKDVDADHVVIDAFDAAWSDYQTYPTVRFDVDKAGHLTSRTEW